MKNRSHIVSFALLLVALTPLISPVRAGEADFTMEVQRRLTNETILPAEDAAGAVNEKITGRFSFHTSEDNPPWWQVDLGEMKPIGLVRIYTSHLSERLSEFRLLTSRDAESWETVHSHGTLTNDDECIEVRLDDIRARYIRVEASDRTWMHLDEVQVFAPNDTQTNLALNQPCNQSSVSEWSNRSVVLPPPDWRSAFDIGRQVVDSILGEIPGGHHDDLATIHDDLVAEEVSLDDPRWGRLYRKARDRKTKLTAFELIDLSALGRALEDLAGNHPDRYPDADELREQLEGYQDRFEEVSTALNEGCADARRLAGEIVAFQRDVLLRNPLLDFDRILILKRGFPDAPEARSAMGGGLGMPANWQTNDNTPRRGHWEDRLVVLSDLNDSAGMETLFDPNDGRTITDPTLDFDADRILFGMEGTEQRNWRIFEIDADGSGLRQVTPDDGVNVAHMDPCYLPDGNLLFTSTAGFMGLPCVFGSDSMVCLYRMDRAEGNISQLSFDQDSSWSPTMLANGRVLYQRWEYSDIAHSNSRMLFHMNPDGTDQREYWGSGSYFPPSFFYAKPIPDHPRKVIGVASGHHGTSRSGRLLLVDPARGRREAGGVIQEIPGYGKEVEPIVRDRLVDGVWPQFLHLSPLSSKYHLVAAKPSPDSLWGIYLIDVFDNMTLIKELEGSALLWPIPLRKTPRPPVIPKRVDLDDPEGRLLIQDIYEGDGLDGIPRGTVSALRIFEYYFSYRDTGGLLGSIGMDGPWDIKRVLGTVPVEEDGSAFFSVPAQTPISIQPLDKRGQALQLMRSWTVVQPGENASCIGCHESQSQAPPPAATDPPKAARREPSPIEAGWLEPLRGFSYEREIQPVLDRHCVGCHDGSLDENGKQIPYLKSDRRFTDWSTQIAGNVGGRIDRERLESYAQLHRYLRRPGIESDMRMLSPMDYHFSATELGQMLRKGHHGVELDEESWDRLVTWFDLNVPYHGTWGEMGHNVERQQTRAHELRECYAPHNIRDYEHIPDQPSFDREFQPPEPQEPEHEPATTVAGWPFDAEEAKRRQVDAVRAADMDDGPEMSIDLGEGSVFPTAYLGHDDTRPAIDVGPVRLELVLVPGGRFVMGSSEGHPDEYPYTAVEVEPFWMARFQVSNAMYRIFDPHHESRDESRHGYQFGRRGFYQDAPEQPVVRVSWNEARAFCDWLSEKTGLDFDLPTEAQWEWAARAGSDSAFHFGGTGADYSPYANLADRKLQEFAQCTSSGSYTRAHSINNPNRYDDWIPRCEEYDDGGLVTVDVGSYLPNPFGLYDMHGNAAEWTLSAYKPYPYRADDGRNDASRENWERVARGGSWRDRPNQATASHRRPYHPYHRVFNVGFRVVVPAN